VTAEQHDAAAGSRFSGWMQTVGAGAVGLWIAAIWGFAEGTVWFIAPDFIVIVLSVFAPSAWRRLVAAALAGDARDDYE
jgi:hypothetical protein